MTQEKLFDAIDGLSAYDSGCTDSGIHDELLRQRVKDCLNGFTEEEFSVTMSVYIREHFVSEEAIKQGYGIEDVAYFITWLDKSMGFSL